MLTLKSSCGGILPLFAHKLAAPDVSGSPKEMLSLAYSTVCQLLLSQDFCSTGFFG